MCCNYISVIKETDREVLPVSDWNPPELTKPSFLGFILVRFLGLEICPECHSRDIKQEGWEDYHHRHYCSRCKKTFAISGYD